MKASVPSTSDYSGLESVVKINVIEPEIVQGNQFQYKIKSGNHVKLICTGLLEDLTEIRIDNHHVDKSFYDLESGSTVLTLHHNYLDTLPLGHHFLQFIYGNTVVTTSFEIQINHDSSIPTPNHTLIPPIETLPPIKNEIMNQSVFTNDTTYIIESVIILVMSLTLIVIVSQKKDIFL